MANAEKGEIKEWTLKLIRTPKDLLAVPLFANHVIVSNTPNEFILHFVYIDADKAEEAAKSQAAELEVSVVVSVGLSPDSTKNFLVALQDNIGKFQKKLALMQKESEG